LTAPARVYEFHIDDEGDWWSDGWFLDDPELRDQLSRQLFLDDGQLKVRCQDEIHPVTAAITPLFVRDVEVGLAADGVLRSVHVVLHDGRTEPLKAETLRVDDRDRLLCEASDVPLPALFFRPAFYRLMQHLQEHDGRHFFDIDGIRCYVAGSEETS
jgi:hypothetical protein